MLPFASKAAPIKFPDQYLHMVSHDYQMNGLKEC